MKKILKTVQNNALPVACMIGLWLIISTLSNMAFDAWAQSRKLAVVLPPPVIDYDVKCTDGSTKHDVTFVQWNQHWVFFNRAGRQDGMLPAHMCGAVALYPEAK